MCREMGFMECIKEKEEQDGSGEDGSGEEDDRPKDRYSGEEFGERRYYCSSNIFMMRIS